MDSGECLFARAENQVRQVASLTKIMTCWVVISLCSKFKIDMKSTLVNVLSPVKEMDGTSA